ncbi:hypothetical protein [Mesorhizobium sp.]|uniref:hypothetical protein n=1 Tax=Mesorhizobium sp. TaxID=1871066 RepID=UPI0025D07363|nr:hypothetical protein [Mesorhizobium sp.]
MIAQAPQFEVAAVAIAQFAGQFDVNYELIFSAALFISVVPMVILSLLQRFYTASVGLPAAKSEGIPAFIPPGPATVDLGREATRKNVPPV